jgi:hypothetical protein
MHMRGKDLGNSETQSEFIPCGYLPKLVEYPSLNFED